MRILTEREKLATYGVPPPPPSGCDPETGCCTFNLTINDRICSIQFPYGGLCKQQGQECSESNECCSESCEEDVCVGWGMPHNADCPFEVDPSCIVPNPIDLPIPCAGVGDEACPPLHSCKMGFCRPPTIL